MKLAYISGQYRNKIPNRVFDNCIKARSMALKYWKDGYAVICPHLNTFLLDGELPDEAWLAGDLRIIEGCDVIVMLPGWEFSEGAKEEHEYAIKFGKEIIYEN